MSHFHVLLITLLLFINQSFSEENIRALLNSDHRVSRVYKSFWEQGYDENKRCVDQLFPPEGFPLRENFEDRLLDFKILKDGNGFEKWGWGSTFTYSLYLFKDPSIVITKVQVDFDSTDSRGYRGRADICIRIGEGGVGYDNVVIQFVGSINIPPVRVKIYGVDKHIPEWDAFDWFTEYYLALNENQQPCNIFRKRMMESSNMENSFKFAHLKASNYNVNDTQYFQTMTHGKRFHYMFEYFNKEKPVKITGYEILNKNKKSPFGCAKIRYPEHPLGQSYVRIYLYADQSDKYTPEQLVLPKVIIYYQNL